MEYIAFDLGASSGKMMLGNFDGERLHTKLIHRFPNGQISANGSLYWNFLGIYQHLTEGLRIGFAQAGAEVAGLGMDAFCNDFGLVGKNGDIINQMHCYRDERTLRSREEVYRLVSREELHRLTGCQNALFNTVIQLAAMRLQGDGYLLDGCDTLLHLPDLLTYLLTGEKKSEYTISSVTQMFDYLSDTWHDGILKRFGIPRSILAPIIEPGTIAGTITANARRDIGIGRLKVIAVGEHDTASAVAALPGMEENPAYISSGTWSLMGVETSEVTTNTDTLKYNIAFEGGVEHRYRMLKNVMGLWLIQECRREYRRMGREYSFGELAAEASSAQPFRSLIDPDWEAFYAPGDMPEKIRSFCRITGQPVPETTGQFIRTIEESLALKYRWVLDILEKLTGKKVGCIHILGGGGQDRLLDQFTANACRKPVYVGPFEAALTGNFLMQMKAGGEISGIVQGREIVRNSFEIEEFQPSDERIWEEKYQYFQSLLKSMEKN